MTVPRPLTDVPAEEGPVTIYQGQTFALGWSFTYEDDDDGPTGTPVDFTGYTGRMQVRSSVAASTTILDLTTANGGVVLSTGTVEIAVTAAATSAIDETGLPIWGAGNAAISNPDQLLLLGVAHVEVESGTGVVTRLIEMDTVLLDPEVTRP